MITCLGKWIVYPSGPYKSMAQYMALFTFNNSELNVEKPLP